MGFIRGMLFGILVCEAVRQITKKNVFTGKSQLDEFTEAAPLYIDKAKSIIGEVKSEIETIKS